MNTPMVSLVISFGSVQRLAHQRQNATTATIITMLTNESSENEPGGSGS